MHYKYKNCVEVGCKVANFLFYALYFSTFEKNKKKFHILH